MDNEIIEVPGIDYSSWTEGCMLHTDFFNSPAAATGYMVAYFAADVLHICVPEVMQDGYPRESFIADLGDVKFVQAAYAPSGERALAVAFEDGSNAPYGISFQHEHVRILPDCTPIGEGRTGWMQFHFGPELFSRIIEYMMIVYTVNAIHRPLPAPPQWVFDKDEISHASKVRLERFVDRFFELSDNDCYDFEEFLAEVYRLFKPEWEYLKGHLVDPWNAGADKHGKGFLRVTKEDGMELGSAPRVDFESFLHPKSNKYE